MGRRLVGGNGQRSQRPVAQARWPGRGRATPSARRARSCVRLAAGASARGRYQGSAEPERGEDRRRHGGDSARYGNRGVDHVDDQRAAGSRLRNSVAGRAVAGDVEHQLLRQPRHRLDGDRRLLAGGTIQVLSNTTTNVIIDVSGYYQ